MSQKASDAFRTISEVAEHLDIPPHVLRFWETKFTSLRPLKRSGGRRYYRPDDVALLERIRDLVYKDGFTIKGAKKYLKDHGVAAVVAIGEGAPRAAPAEEVEPAPARRSGSVRPLEETLDDLQEAKRRLDAALSGEPRLL